MPVQDMTATTTCRLLYYGQPRVGKRENLRLVHQSVPPESRLAVATADPERQIGFTLNQTGQPARKIYVQSVDVGKEPYHTAGRPMRPPFDGIVFVIDAAASKLDGSLAAFESLKAFLDSWGLDLMRVPVVLQYNNLGREETLAVDRLESLLNPWGLLSYPASSPRGDGVKETLKAILGLGIRHLEQQAETMPRLAAQERPQVGSSAASGMEADSPLDLEYGPPLPGTEVDEKTRRRSEEIFNDLRPPLVVPVRIPRRLLEGPEGPVRIMLEVEIED